MIFSVDFLLDKLWFFFLALPAGNSDQQKDTSFTIDDSGCAEYFEIKEKHHPAISTTGTEAVCTVTQDGVWNNVSNAHYETQHMDTSVQVNLHYFLN